MEAKKRMRNDTNLNSEPKFYGSVMKLIGAKEEDEEFTKPVIFLATSLLLFLCALLFWRFTTPIPQQHSQILYEQRHFSSFVNNFPADPRDA